MYDADMIIGWLANGVAYADDYYSDSESQPQLDVTLGGVGNIKLLEGSLDGSLTTITVLRKLDTGDKYDRTILAAGANDMVYAWGNDDELGMAYHDDNHNHVHIDLSKQNGIPDTTFGYEESGELSRDLVSSSFYGTLSTWQSQAAGGVYNFPYGSVADTADDGSGQPFMLLSNLERSVINLNTFPPCSLHIITLPNSTFELNHPEYFDVMTKPRTTLLGHLVAVQDSELEAARDIYLQKHPLSKAWITFSDFIMYRMVVEDVYVVGGFGNEHYIGWISPAQYLAVL